MTDDEAWQSSPTATDFLAEVRPLFGSSMDQRLYILVVEPTSIRPVAWRLDTSGAVIGAAAVSRLGAPQSVSGDLRIASHGRGRESAEQGIADRDLDRCRKRSAVAT